MVDKLLTSPLNRLPEGLLDFFSIKSMGQYPQRFNDAVQGTMDLSRWYSDTAAREAVAQMAAIVAFQSAGTLNIGTTNWTAGGADDPSGGAAATLVPQTELWWVYEATVEWRLGTDAAAFADACLVNQVNFGSIGSYNLTDSDVLGFTTNTGGSRGGSRSLTKPFIALPGSAFFFKSWGINPGANSIDCRVAMRYRRLSR